MRTDPENTNGGYLPWAGAAALAFLLWIVVRQDTPSLHTPSTPRLPAPATETAPPAIAGPETPPNARADLFAVAQDDRVAFPIIERASPAATPAEQSQWTGARVCGECHADNWKSSLHSAHYNTSRLPSREALLGDFQGPGSRMATGDPALSFEMHEQAGRFYQRALQNGRQSHQAAIDLILGSGKMAQTFGTWVKDALFELPVTYYTTAGSWVYSPGYMDGRAFFARPINSGCLECHTTGFIPESAGEKNHRFKSRHILPGVTCERCHGGGTRHVTHHRTHPEDHEARHILDPRKLASSERNALCSQCHGGLNLAGDAGHAPGVHSNNQLQRLRLSACFAESAAMTCTDCHNPHRQERGDAKLFARRCQSCHETDDCSAVTPDRRAHFEENCAACHMPRQPMEDIDFRTTTGEVVSGFSGGKGVSIPEIVDHYIRVVRPNEPSPQSR